MTDRENEINGVCLRGKAGWGEGGAFITVTANSFGARWFDEDWNAQFDQPEWKEALTFFVEMMKLNPDLRVMQPTDSMKIYPCSNRASAACGSMPPSQQVLRD